MQPFAAPIEVRRATSPGTPAQYKPGLIIITSEANQNQVRLQLGHEVFHWLCSPPFYFHWVHEMFAQVMSVRLLRQGGFDAYADESDAAFRESADKLSVEKMLGEAITPPYPQGLHDRAYVVGCELVEAIGWERLKPLATMFDKGNRPDLTGWIASMSTDERQAVAALLGT